MRHLILFLVLVFQCPLVFSGELDKKLHEMCLYPAVTMDAVTINAMGSGVIIRSDEISKNIYHNVVVTCAHVLNPSSQYNVLVPRYENWSRHVGYDRYDCYIYTVSPKYDLAVVLFISDKPMHIAEFAPVREQFYIGNNVLRVGSGINQPPRIDYGKITGIFGTGPKAIHRTSVNSVPGDSGGGVYDESNHLIGWINRIASDPQSKQHIYHMSNFVPVSKLRTLNKEKDGEIDFCFDKEEILPVLPFVKMHNFAIFGELLR